MSLNTTINRVSYLTNGVTVDFAFPYYFLADADLVVIKRLNVDPFTEVQLVLNTDYTVGNAGNPSGGSITLTPVIASGYTLSIYRQPAETQDLVLVENDELPTDSVEKAFDKLMMVIQNLSDLISRSVRLSDGFPANTFDLTLPNNLAAGTVFVVNSLGTGLSSGPTADEIANAQTYATNALASSVAAAASAASASSSASAAAASAASAATSAINAANTLASALWRDAVFKTTNYTVLSSDNGKLFVVDSTSGPITITIPLISGLTLPFNIGVKRQAGTNTVTIQTSGGDVIGSTGTGSLLLVNDEQGVELIAETGTWTDLAFGATQGAGISVVTKTTNYTTTDQDDVVLVNTGSGDVTITLHTAADVVKKRITIKKISLDSNMVIIDGNASETIDGELTVTLRAVREALTIEPDGSNWFTESWYESSRYALYNEVYASGTENPSNGSAAVWETRILNTVSRSAIWSSLSSNQITLQPGAYRVVASAPGATLSRFRLRFRNITDSTTAILGQSTFEVPGALCLPCLLNGFVTLSAAKTFELQMYHELGNTSNGHGVSSATGESEVYAQIEIERINPRSS